MEQTGGACAGPGGPWKRHGTRVGLAALGFWVAFGLPVLSDLPPKISFLPLTTQPIVPRGDLETGDPVLDAGFIRESIFSASIATDGAHVFLAFRSDMNRPGAEPVGGIGLWRSDLSDLTDPRELGDRDRWDKLHHRSPLFDVQTAEPGVVGAPTSLNATVIEGDLHILFKLKRKTQPARTVSVADARGGIDLGFPVQFREDMSVFRLGNGKRKRLSRANYTIEPLGTGEDATLRYHAEQPGKGELLLEYAWNGWRYGLVSADAGRSFVGPTLMLNEKGNKAPFGGASITRVGKTWFMAQSGKHRGVLLRRSEDGRNWGEAVPIIDLGPAGSGYEHHVVGNALSVAEEDGETYLVIFATGGGGKMVLKGKEQPAFDYPETVHLFRAPVARAQDPAAWTPYRYNPVMMRGSATGETGGAIWQFNAVPVLGSHVAAFEGFGVAEDFAGDPETVGLIRDYQYGTPKVRFGQQAYSQAFLSIWPEADLMGAWNDDFYDPGRFTISPSDRTDDPVFLTLDGSLTNLPLPALVSTRTDLWIGRQDGFHVLGPEEGVEDRLVHASLIGPEAVAVEPAVDAAAMAEWLILVDGDTALFQNRYSGDFLTVVGEGVEARPFTGEAAQRWHLDRQDP